MNTVKSSQERKVLAKKKIAVTIGKSTLTHKSINA